jgi:hypothetical protein
MKISLELTADHTDFSVPLTQRDRKGIFKPINPI